MSIPGYSPTSINVQDHIHLGLVPAGGGSPSGFDGDGAPPYKFAVNKRTPMWSQMSNFVQSWDGTPFPHFLSDSDGYAITFENFQYKLLCSWDDIEILKRLLGNTVYLVDNRHADNGHIHTTYVKYYQFTEMTDDDHLDPMLLKNEVTIFLRDVNTVQRI